MIRVQFEVSEEGARELATLMELAGLATKKELFNNALALLQWAVQEVRGGKRIASIDEERQIYKEFVMPALTTAARKAA